VYGSEHTRQERAITVFDRALDDDVTAAFADADAGPSEDDAPDSFGEGGEAEGHRSPGRYYVDAGLGHLDLEDECVEGRHPYDGGVCADELARLCEGLEDDAVEGGGDGTVLYGLLGL
jgi:hypothetical protein